MLRPAVLLILGTPAAAWLTHPFLKSGVESSWMPPRETAAAEVPQERIAMGWTPQPTQAPKALVGRMLAPRMDEYTMGPETCGFDPLDGASLTCITSGATCTYQAGYIGCCEPNEPCSIVKTACMNYQSSVAGSCNLPNDFHTLCCSEAAMPACYSYVLSTSGGGDRPDETFTLFDCATSSGVGTLLNYDPEQSQTHSSASTTDPTPSETETSNPDSSEDGNDGDGSSDSARAIVGGPLGGVAVLLLVAEAVFFLV